MEDLLQECYNRRLSELGINGEAGGDVCLSLECKEEQVRRNEGRDLKSYWPSSSRLPWLRASRTCCIARYPGGRMLLR